MGLVLILRSVILLFLSVTVRELPAGFSELHWPFKSSVGHSQRVRRHGSVVRRLRSIFLSTPRHVHKSFLRGFILPP